jgi:hypothetical protein
MLNRVEGVSPFYGLGCGEDHQVLSLIVHECTSMRKHTACITYLRCERSSTVQRLMSTQLVTSRQPMAKLNRQRMHPTGNPQLSCHAGGQKPPLFVYPKTPSPPRTPLQITEREQIP